MFPFPKRTPLLSKDESNRVVQAIRDAEVRTSGEIRVYVELRNPLVNPLDRAALIFTKLEMDKTKHRNAVLIYVATRHRELAIYGDEGIHQQLGKTYWENEIAELQKYFSRGDMVNGLISCITHIGHALHERFPYVATEDKNELPDEIVFGK